MINRVRLIVHDDKLALTSPRFNGHNLTAIAEAIAVNAVAGDKY